MNKKMYAKSHAAAEIIYNSLCIKSSCFIGPKQKLVRADYIVAIDDDPTSALWAVWLYYKSFREYGYYPTILCVGGKGALSKYTHRQSEAERSAEVCKSLGVNIQNIFLVSSGTNTGANVQEVKKVVNSGQCVIWSLTKRLSLRMERTIAKQAPEIISYYYVIEETMDKAANLMNGKGLADKELMFHELASILERCQAYAGTFQEPIGDIVELTPEILEADAFLRKHYRLKLLDAKKALFGKTFRIPNKNLKSIFQMLHLFCILKLNRKNMQNELEWEISKMALLLHRQNLLS